MSESTYAECHLLTNKDEELSFQAKQQQEQQQQAGDAGQPNDEKKYDNPAGDCLAKDAELLARMNRIYQSMKEMRKTIAVEKEILKKEREANRHAELFIQQQQGGSSIRAHPGAIMRGPKASPVSANDLAVSSSQTSEPGPRPSLSYRMPSSHPNFARYDQHHLLQKASAMKNSLEKVEKLCSLELDRLQKIMMYRKRSRAMRSHSENETNLPTKSSQTIDTVSYHHRRNPDDLILAQTGHMEDLREMIASLARSVKAMSEKNRPTVTFADQRITETDIPFFDAEQNCDVRRWINQIEKLRNMGNWTEVETARYAIRRLAGLAKKWYNTLSRYNYTWEEWKSKLCRAFPKRYDYRKILEAMLSRKKHPDETYASYYYDMIEMTNRAKITGRNAVSVIIGGIEDVSVRAGARCMRFDDPEELLEYLFECEELTRQSLHKQTMQGGGGGGGGSNAKVCKKKRSQLANPGSSTTQKLSATSCASGTKPIVACEQRDRSDRIERLCRMVRAPDRGDLRPKRQSSTQRYHHQYHHHGGGGGSSNLHAVTSVRSRCSLRVSKSMSSISTRSHCSRKKTSGSSNKHWVP